MAILTAYFDESDTKGAAVVGGFIAEADQWVYFSKEWRTLLKDYRLKAFHMKDYVHSRNEFKLWKGDERKRRCFLERAIGIIHRRIRAPIVSVIDRPNYDAFVTTDRRRRAFGSPYVTPGLCTDYRRLVRLMR